MQRAALLSVSNRSGLEAFAKGLQEQGFELLTTSGTAKFLQQHGIKSTAIESYTGQREIMDGRVKTLHPKIYAGILARRNNQEDLAELSRENILPIDVVAVNLYPFSSNVGQGKTLQQMIELIDIGGPSMIRASAKNFASVWPVVDPNDYSMVLEGLRRPATETQEIRQQLAVKVFAHLAQDNLEVSSFFSSSETMSSRPPAPPRPLGALSPVSGMVLRELQGLRYGENPRQRACYYSISGGEKNYEQLGGKELSYNNLLDVDAALRLMNDLGAATPTAVIVKHLNPCGVASGSSLADALQRAKRCDPRSHFGGILAFNGCLDRTTAEEVREDFAEIVVAPEFQPDALDILKTSKTLRLLRARPLSLSVECRVALGGLLVQEVDSGSSPLSQARLVAGAAPGAKIAADLELAWKLAAHVKSNAIVLVKDGMLIGAGAGQMSRIDSVELAIHKAKTHGHDLKGAVASSDAFFPFPDSVETLSGEGIAAIVAPSGAKRDPEVIDTAKRCGIALLFTEDRHFRH